MNLAVDGLSLRTRGRGRPLLPASFSVDAGEIVGLVGVSGSGKTLLLCALAGLAPHAIVQGSAQVAQPIGMVFANDALDDGDSAIDNVVIAAEAAGVPHPRAAASAVLARLGVDETTARRSPRALSGGQRKRTGIARALVVRPRVLLLDDPTAGLDPVTAAAVLDVIADEAAAAAVLIATQDVDTVLPRTRRTLQLLPRRDGSVAVEMAATHALRPPFRPRPFARFLPSEPEARP